MGVTADDHIHTHVAELLSHGSLVGVGALAGLPFVFFAPVKVDDRGLGPGGFHLIQIALELGVEFGEFVIGKVVQNAVFAYFVVIQQGIAVLTETIGIGVAHHADLDAVDLFNGPFLLIGGEIGPEGVQSLFTDNVQRPLVAHKGGVVAWLLAVSSISKPAPFKLSTMASGQLNFGFPA